MVSLKYDLTLVPIVLTLLQSFKLSWGKIMRSFLIGFSNSYILIKPGGIFKNYLIHRIEIIVLLHISLLEKSFPQSSTM